MLRLAERARQSAAKVLKMADGSSRGKAALAEERAKRAAMAAISSKRGVEPLLPQKPKKGKFVEVNGTDIAMETGVNPSLLPETEEAPMPVCKVDGIEEQWGEEQDSEQDSSSDIHSVDSLEIDFSSSN